MNQLTRLAQPFPADLIQNPPQGKRGKYVSHSTITEALLNIVGPYSLTVVETVRGHAPEIKTKNNTFSARDNAIVGVIARLTVTIDAHTVSVDEAGSVEQPAMNNDGENLKLAISDALKRCAMRIGLGLHLWSQEDYFLDRELADEEPAKQTNKRPESAKRTATTESVADEPVRGGLSPEKVTGLHAQLAGFGVPQLLHAEFATAAIGREVSSFKELTTKDAAVVYNAGVDLANGVIEYRDGAILAAGPA